MKNVLRLNSDGSISHQYLTTHEGQVIYLTKKAYDKLNDLSQEHINEYYSGEDHDEVISLRNDMYDIISSSLSIEIFKLRIALFVGLVKQSDKYILE